MPDHDGNARWSNLIANLQAVWNTLASLDFLAEIARIPIRDARELRRWLLRLAGWLEDSVSNSRLGSLFDRKEVTALNEMLIDLARAYGVAATFAGTTGTTGLNVPAVMALAREGEEVGIGRDSHVSIMAGVALSGATPRYLVPPFDTRRGVLLPPTPAEVAAFLDRHAGVRSLILTSPTYHGLVGDLDGIVEQCHRREVRLFVDGAHGPHLHFLQEAGFPRAAEDAGADIVSGSTHKVLSALNQASLIHFKYDDHTLLERYEELQALGFQSTSFSYPILISIEHAVEQVASPDGRRSWEQAALRARRLRDGASQLRGVEAIDESVVDGERVCGLDPVRVTMNFRASGLTGYQVADALLRRGLIVELATPDVLLLLVSPSVNDEMVRDTLTTIEELVRIPSRAMLPPVFRPPGLPALVATPREALDRPDRERVPVRAAAGRVSAETIGCYPPGQAIFVAGEQLTMEGIEYLQRAVEAGGHLKRVQDDGFQTICVLREPR